MTIAYEGLKDTKNFAKLQKQLRNTHRHSISGKKTTKMEKKSYECKFYFLETKFIFGVLVVGEN